MKLFFTLLMGDFYIIFIIRPVFDDRGPIFSVVLIASLEVQNGKFIVLNTFPVTRLVGSVGLVLVIWMRGIFEMG